MAHLVMEMAVAATLNYDRLTDEWLDACKVASDVFDQWSWACQHDLPGREAVWEKYEAERKVADAKLARRDAFTAVAPKCKFLGYDCMSRFRAIDHEWKMAEIHRKHEEYMAWQKKHYDSLEQSRQFVDDACRRERCRRAGLTH